MLPPRLAELHDIQIVRLVFGPDGCERFQPDPRQGLPLDDLPHDQRLVAPDAVGVVPRQFPRAGQAFAHFHRDIGRGERHQAQKKDRQRLDHAMAEEAQGHKQHEEKDQGRLAVEGDHRGKQQEHTQRRRERPLPAPRAFHRQIQSRPQRPQREIGVDNRVLAQPVDPGFRQRADGPLLFGEKIEPGYEFQRPEGRHDRRYDQQRPEPESPVFGPPQAGQQHESEDLEDENYIKNTYIVFATQQGQIKKTPLEAYSRPRAGGIKAITINEGDELIEVIKTDGNSWIMLGSLYGQAVRFHESDVRPMGRTAAGVRGIRLSRHKDDRVVGMLTVNDENETILPITENGYGKRSPLSEYRITKRGGKGVRTMNITEKTGKLVAIGNVIEDEEVMIITKSGLAIRLKVSNVRVMGRATQGVRLIRLIDGDQVVSVARVISDSDEEEIDNDTENMVISKEEQEKEEVVEAPDNDEDETDEAEPDDEQITENE